PVGQGGLPGGVDIELPADWGIESAVQHCDHICPYRLERPLVTNIGRDQSLLRVTHFLNLNLAFYSLAKRGSNDFRWRSLDKVHIHKRSAVEIYSILRAALDP